MTSRTSRRPASDIDGLWKRFKASRAQVLGSWVEAERALALAKQQGTTNGDSGDRLLAAEAALQGAIVNFAAAEVEGDPQPLALSLLRLAEGELFVEPPDLRRPNGRDRRRAERRASRGADRRG